MAVGMAAAVITIQAPRLKVAQAVALELVTVLAHITLEQAVIRPHQPAGPAMETQAEALVTATMAEAEAEVQVVAVVTDSRIKTTA